MERIQKILAQGGLASRRAAEQLITEGRVRVNGRVVSELGAKADARNDRIEVDGKRVVAEHHVYIVLHKPRGVVATMSDPEGRPTVNDILQNVGARVFPVGRLDFATSGVLLVTNDGAFSEGLLHPKKAVPKTYIVKVKGKMAKEDTDHWRNGVNLEDGKTLPAEANLVRFDGDKTWFELTIKEGRNQQIRRMGEATGFPVMRLARLSFAAISADGLRPGQWRHLTREELHSLKKAYGVPRSIPAPPEEAPAPARRLRAGSGRPQTKNGPAARATRVGVEQRPKGPVGERFTSRDRVAGAERASRVREEEAPPVRAPLAEER
ncbi:MAG: Ribosomal large subunit pseudouridine synthase, partial [Labilithrix sp.]|nr:Ribosomal large subunit pseudouridine synthase [Labilithrix sp.]